MDYRTPLQHLLHKLLPSVGHADYAPTALDFADTRPEDHSPAPTAARPFATTRQQIDIRSASTIDLELGSEIMELPDDTSADLLDEFFAGSQRRAA